MEYLGAKQETIMFLAVAISAGCYYYMWSGFGVNKKLDSAGNTRMVFFGHFVDRLFSMPLVIYSLCLVANAEMGETILLLGLDMLMVLCSAIGATQLHPWKWIWSLPLLSLSLPPFWQTSPLSTVMRSGADLQLRHTHASTCACVPPTAV